MEEKISKRQKALLKEEEIKKKMSEKAYLGRTLDKKLQYLQTLNFSQKFMAIAFGVFTLIIGVTLFLDYGIFWIILTAVFGSIFIASIVWIMVFRLKYKPKLDGEINEIRQKILQFNKQENEKILKASELLKRQKTAENE